MKVTCPGCNANFAVDDNRIPPQGLQVRCPKCFKAIEIGGAEAPSSDLEASLGIDLSGPSGEPAEGSDDGWGELELTSPEAEPLSQVPPVQEESGPDLGDLDPLSTSDLNMIGTYGQVGKGEKPLADVVWSDDMPLGGKAAVKEQAPEEETSPEQPLDEGFADSPLFTGERTAPEPVAAEPAAAEPAAAEPAVEEPPSLDSFSFEAAADLDSGDDPFAADGVVGQGDEDLGGGFSQPLAPPAETEQLFWDEEPAQPAPPEPDELEPAPAMEKLEEAPDSIFAIEEQSGVFSAKDIGVAGEGEDLFGDGGADSDVDLGGSVEMTRETVAPIELQEPEQPQVPPPSEAQFEQTPMGGGPTLDDIDFASLLDDVPGGKGKEEDVFFVDTPSVPESEFETPKSADSFSMEEISFDDLDSLDGGGDGDGGGGGGDVSAEDDLFDLDMGTDELQSELPAMDLDLPMPDASQVRAEPQGRPRHTPKKKKGVIGLVLTLIILVGGGGAAYHFGVFDSLLNTKQLPLKSLAPKTKKTEFGPRLLGTPGAYDDQLQKLVKELEISPVHEVEISVETMWVLAWYKFLFPAAFEASKALGEKSLDAEFQKLTKTKAGSVFKAKIEAMQLAPAKEWVKADARFSEYLNLKAKKMAELLEKNQLTAVVAREDNLLSAWFAVENGRFDEAQGLLQDLIGEKAGELYPTTLLARTHAGKAASLEAAGKDDEAQAERNRAIDRLMEVVEKYPATTDAKLLLSGLLAREDKLDQALVLAQECLDTGKKAKNLALQVQSYRSIVHLLQKKQDEDVLLSTLEEMKVAVLGKKAGIEEPEDLLLILCGLYIKKNRIQQALGALELCSSCDSAEFFLLHSTTYERSKLYHTAVEKAKLGHDKYPDHAGLLMMLARLSQQTGQSNSAVAYLEQVLKLKPDNLDAAVTLAKLFLELNDPSNARRVLLQAERFVESSVELQEMLAKINEAMGDDAGTISALRKLIKIKGDDKLRKKLAKYLVKQGSYEEALIQFEVLHSKNLITQDLRQGYAKSLKATGRIQDAVDVLKELFRDDPGDREAARFLADIYLQKEDFFNAKFYLEAARRADSKNAEIHYLIGTSCLKLQEDDCAVEAFRQAVELEPEKLEYAELFANQLFKMSKGMKGKELKDAYRQARKYFDFIIARYENDPTIPKDRHNADVYFNRGKILFDTGHFAKALNDLDKALFLAKHRFDILIAFADTLYKMNRYDDALEYYQEMIDSDIDIPHAYYYRGHIFLTTGKREKAKANLLKCIAKDAKRFPDAHRFLGNIFKEKGLKKKARDHYKTFLELAGKTHPAAEEVRSALSKLY